MFVLGPLVQDPPVTVALRALLPLAAAQGCCESAICGCTTDTRSCGMC